MPSPSVSSESGSLSRSAWGGIGAVGGAVLLAAAAGLWKLLAISSVAFVAMAGGAWLGAHPVGSNSGTADQARGLAWGYGLASGAMIASTGAFLIPSAVGHSATIGGFGIAAGVLLGFVMHVAQHQLAHLPLPGDVSTLELTAHSLAAGLVIGAVYATMPALDLALGLAIVSHKAPAGYAAAHRLVRSGRDPSVLLVPAAAVAVAAVPVGLLSPPSTPGTHALVFGIATGILLHVAFDFLPQCELGGEIAEAAGLTRDGKAPDGHFDEQHHLLDHLRLHAVSSAVLGGGLVFVAWWMTHL